MGKFSALTTEGLKLTFGNDMLHFDFADSNNEETQSRDLWERGASFLIGMITAESRNDVNRRCTDKGVWRKNQRSKEEMVDMLKTLIQNHVAQLREKHQHDNPHSCKRLPEIASEIWISLPCQSTAWSQDVHATNAGLEVFADAVSREMQIILQMKQHVHLYGGLPMGRHCALRKRWKRYQIELAHAHPSETVIARRRMWEQIPGWSWACRTLEEYIPSTSVGKDSFGAIWSKKPVVRAPITCQLCGQGCMHTEALFRHCAEKHKSYTEYSKRLLYRLQEAGPQKVTPQEQRSIVQSFAQFQCCSVASSGCNDWVPHSPDQLVPRREEACGVCARLDWIENRFMVDLWADDGDSENLGCEEYRDIGGSDSEDSTAEQDGQQERRASGSAVSNAKAVNEYLNVFRYMQAFPLIPKEELLGSAIQHPRHPEFLWLLHSRRIPVQSMQHEPPKCCTGSQIWF